MSRLPVHPQTAREDLMHRSFNAAIEQCAKIAESMPASQGTAIAKAIRSLSRQVDPTRQAVSACGSPAAMCADSDVQRS